MRRGRGSDGRGDGSEKRGGVVREGEMVVRREEG